MAALFPEKTIRSALNAASGKSFLNFFRFGFKAGLFKQGKHVLFISFNTRLVKRIDAQQVTADAAGFFEEVHELSQEVLVKHGQAQYGDWGHHHPREPAGCPVQPFY